MLNLFIRELVLDYTFEPNDKLLTPYSETPN